MDAAPDTRHPCQRCGACCAAFVVAFHWSETLPDAFGVPASRAGMLDSHRLAMHGTLSDTPRCTALQGRVGGDTSCTIYAQRPSPCREVAAAWEDGTPSPQCDRARQRHGLAPLQPADWARFSGDIRAASLHEITQDAPFA